METASEARSARKAVSLAQQEADVGSEVVTRTIDAIRRIENASNQITQIISVIDEISFQTNLLALNAGVEAARAGETGRGFAVVASEVRALAQRSTAAAQDIKKLISSSTSEVSKGVELVEATGAALAQIVVRVSEVSTTISNIVKVAEEQSGSLSEVNTALRHLDVTTQQNAAMVEETSAATAPPPAAPPERALIRLGRATFSHRAATGEGTRGEVPLLPSQRDGRRCPKGG
jgi:methyl-accepting chemotaxis protein